jgi:hypothetical protein
MYGWWMIENNIGGGNMSGKTYKYIHQYSWKYRLRA